MTSSAAGGWTAGAVLCLSAALWAGGPSPAAAVPPDPSEPGEASHEEPDREASPGRAAAERFSGLFHGAVLYRPGGTELEIVVELAPGPDGELVGTLSMPAYEEVTYKPLESFRVDGREIYFNYRHDSEIRGPDALYEFEGELSEDGEVLTGEFLEARGRIPFRLERIGDPGSPGLRLEKRPLHDLQPSGEALAEAFNQHRDHARLVLLLSPT